MKYLKSLFLSCTLLLSLSANAADTSPDMMWGHPAEMFGTDTAYAYPWLVVSAPNEVDGQGNQGKVMLFKEVSPSSFTLVQTLSAGQLGFENLSNLGYGKSVGIAKDGDHYIVAIGAPGYDSSTGAVFTYAADQYGNYWGIRQILGSDATNGEQFGHSVDVTIDRLIVGAPYYDHDHETGFLHDIGRAHVYAKERNKETFEYVEAIRPPDNALSSYMRSGWSVAIGYTRALVPNHFVYALGSPDAYVGGSRTGDVFLYTEDNGQTLPGPVDFIRNIGESGLSSYDDFGFDVDMSDELLIVGVPAKDGGYNNMGFAFIYKVFHDAMDEGAIELENVWTAYDGNTSKQQAYAYFGSSVAIKRTGAGLDNYIAVSGAPEMDRSGNYGTGSGFVMNSVNGSWYFWQVYNPLLSDYAREGKSVVITGNGLGYYHALTGAPGEGLIQSYFVD